MNKRKEIHERVLTASNKNELSAAYGEWAEAYDSDLVDEMGYMAHELAAKLLIERLGKNHLHILDAGCGTGLVGQVLFNNHFTNIDGLDFSKDMLKKAEEKEVYQSLKHGDLTVRLDIAEDTYDAIISVGTFTCAHVGPQALKELV